EKEVIDKLNKAKEVLRWCQENANEEWMVKHLALVMLTIAQALAELQKHLDYGFYGDEFRVFVKDKNGKFQAYDERGWANTDVLNGECWKNGSYKIKGNIKDFINPLKRNSEDLEEVSIS
ncbi:unnamed protein product, partial [marine sediment metagenome]